jgi:hypothetical protein
MDPPDVPAIPSVLRVMYMNLRLGKRLEALAAPGCGSGIGRAVDGPLYFLYYPL